MELPFLNRDAERARLQRALDAGESLLCLYGRRRLGKSRLLREVVRGRNACFYSGDARDGALQRTALAREMGRVIPGLDRVSYPDWEILLERWWKEAPAGSLLVLDEFPFLVKAVPELPSLLQKQVDRAAGPPLVLCGSSQRMMQGLVLDASAPLYGRAREILRIGPLEPRWIRSALGLSKDTEAVEQYAVWGGVPRYWELAIDYPDRVAAVRDLVLDPQGVLHDEPRRLLLDELQDLARSASVLALVGAGCARLSEIGARLEVPATSLSRPLSRLVELGLVRREVPFGTPPRKAKRSQYTLSDPFLAFWYRFVEPNRSRLSAGLVQRVADEIEEQWPDHLGRAWEDLVRNELPRISPLGEPWEPAQRWWGPGTDRKPLELDLVARSARDPRRVLVGEAKRTVKRGEAAGLLASLERRARACPPLVGMEIVPTLWVLRGSVDRSEPRVLGPEDALGD